VAIGDGVQTVEYHSGFVLSSNFCHDVSNSRCLLCGHVIDDWFLHFSVRILCTLSQSDNDEPRESAVSNLVFSRKAQRLLASMQQSPAACLRVLSKHD